MSLIIKDRVRDTSTTTGTGAFTLAGAPPQTYRSFASVCANADTIWYCISHRTADEWEVGIGTSNGGTTLTRTTVLASSNSNAAVSFSAGTKDVFSTLPADRHVYGFNIPGTASWYIIGGNPASTGDNNFGAGQGAALATTSGVRNVAIGRSAMEAATDSSDNVAVGFGALLHATSGVINSVFIGSYSGLNVADCANNIGIGYLSLYSATTGGIGNVGIGSLSLGIMTTGVSNVAVGYSTMIALLGGSGNSGLGAFSLQAATSGSYNVGLGYAAGVALTDGGYNVAIGEYALGTNVHGVANICIGPHAGYNSSTDYNILVGYYAGYGISTGTNNITIGVYSSSDTGVSANVTTGSSNITIGIGSRVADKTASSQLCIGNYIYGTGFDGSGSIISNGRVGLGIKAPACELDVLGPIRATGYTVAGLPAAGTAGRRAYVTDASTATPAFMATLTGGGSANVPVFDDGTVWRYG